MATAATMMVTASERLSAEIAGLEERLRVKGGLWEDQQARLNALRDVRDWMDEEQRQRDEIEVVLSCDGSGHAARP